MNHFPAFVPLFPLNWGPLNRGSSVFVNRVLLTITVFHVRWYLGNKSRDCARSFPPSRLLRVSMPVSTLEATCRQPVILQLAFPP